MTRNAPLPTRGDRLRAVAACMLAASLVACGGGGGSGSTPPAPPPPPPPPPPPAGVQCTDPTPAVSSTVLFAAPPASAASSVGVSSNGTSACFVGTEARGVKSNVAITPGATNFFYFEAQRSAQDGVAFGVSETADAAPPSGSTFAPRKDTLVISGTAIQSVDSAGNTWTANAGDGNVFGFAVDFRAQYPIVNVIGPASANSATCAPLAGSAPCVLSRWQLAAPAASLFIYAYGSGDGTTGPRATINTGSNPAAKPFTYSTPAVMAALRTSRVQGDREFNAQWPAAGGPAVQPTLARVGHDRVVIRSGDTTPYRSQIAVTPTEAGSGTITWRDGKSPTSTALGTGASLAMSVLSGLAAGEHAVTASVVNPTNGRYADVTFRVLVLTAAVNTDDDGDGLTYDQEKAALLDPGNPDSDGDGLSDGAESGLGTNPLVADNIADATLPRRAALVTETTTSRGLIVGDDGLSVVFTSELNPACVQHVGVFNDPVYFSALFGDEERCRKRAIRANVGVTKGEFRYFETQRFSAAANLENVGQGIITPSAQIDPYCCYVDPTEGAPLYPYNGTPPSMTVNSVGGVFVKLIHAEPGFSPALELTNTQHYGFAVDYTGTEPKVYVVARDGMGAMTVSQALEVTGFADAAAMPMLHGHPTSETAPSSAMNLGLQRFHYDLAAVKAALDARGAVTTNFRAGVGAHRWQ